MFKLSQAARPSIVDEVMTVAYVGHMTEAPQPATVPQWTLGDRMRKAREHAGLKQTDLARDTGIGRSSIVNYETGRYAPSRPVLLSWALCTGVPLTWLTGDDDDPWPGIRQARERAGVRKGPT